MPVAEHSEHLVRIEGVALGMFDQWIGDHKARVVEEWPEKQRGAGFARPDAPVVYSITISKKGEW